MGIPAHTHVKYPISPRFRRTVPRRRYRVRLGPYRPGERIKYESLSHDFQYAPPSQQHGFGDIVLIVLRHGVLDDATVCILESVSGFLHPSRRHLLNTWVYPPRAPYRPRCYGFGTAEIGRTTAHDSINPVMMVHFVWIFLTPKDRLNSVQVCPTWWRYSKLRVDAMFTPISMLQAPRPTIPEADFPTTLDPFCAQLHSLALLRFDFRHGDVIRWLGGEYTNADRQFDAEWLNILLVLDAGAPPAECPPVDPISAFRVQTGGVPLKADYVTPHIVPKIRDAYNNHPAVADNMAKVEAKFAKEEWKCYHLHYHRWLFPFIPGLIIAPIQWVFDKGKGRICIDCTNGPPGKHGSVNTFIPKPSNAKKPPKDMVLDEDACPPTYFKYAFKRAIRRILRMRRTRPTTPILVHTDDIDAAFRRILYHPDMAVAFAYFFGDYLMVPVSQVFGGRSCPPYYGRVADVREQLAMVRPFDDPVDFHPLVLESTFSFDDTTPLVQIPEDSHLPP